MMTLDPLELEFQAVVIGAENLTQVPWKSSWCLNA